MGSKLSVRAAYSAILRAENERDPKRRSARYTGRSGRGFFDYLADLFTLNEHLPLRQRKSDSTLQQLIKEEFVKIPDIVRRIESSRYSINYYRNYFNSGRLIQYRRPERISFRWGSGCLTGLPVNFVTGTRELTVEEIVKHIRRYRGTFAPLANDLPQVPSILKAMLVEGLILE